MKAVAKESAAILKDMAMEDTLEMRIISSDIFSLDSINNADEMPTLVRPAIHMPGHSATPQRAVPAKARTNPETPIPPCLAEQLDCPTAKLTDDISAMSTNKLQDPVLATSEGKAQQQDGKEI
jgi:hypothetical protein